MMIVFGGVLLALVIAPLITSSAQQTRR